MGLAASLAGWVVTTAPSGKLINFHWLGWIAVAAGAISIWLGSRVQVHETDAVLPALSKLNAPLAIDAPSASAGGLPVNPEPSIEN